MSIITKTMPTTNDEIQIAQFVGKSQEGNWLNGLNEIIENIDDIKAPNANEAKVL